MKKWKTITALWGKKEAEGWNRKLNFSIFSVNEGQTGQIRETIHPDAVHERKRDGGMRGWEDEGDKEVKGRNETFIFLLETVRWMDGVNANTIRPSFHRQI